MEAVIFVGLQASGKSSFYTERFFSTHVRISLDLLRTRNRERRLLTACLETQQPFVIDNTNPSREERTKYDVGKGHVEVFGEIRPAATMVEVRRLVSPDHLVEIEVDAVVTCQPVEGS